MKKLAIITAGGIGTRLGSSIPKQFLTIAGKAIILHSIDKFWAYDQDMRIIVTLPDEGLDHWSSLLEEFPKYKKVEIVKGGKNRFDSVKNALDNAQDEELVAIHDAVRPLVNTEIISNSFDTAKESGSAITCIRLKDSIREFVDSQITESRRRERYLLVQTPQTFRLKEIQKAYQNAPGNNFTDDASVWEASGKKIVVIEGSEDNLKITYPKDLILAEVLMDN